MFFNIQVDGGSLVVLKSWLLSVGTWWATHRCFAAARNQASCAFFPSSAVILCCSSMGKSPQSNRSPALSEMSRYFNCSYYLRFVQVLGVSHFSSFFRWKCRLPADLVTWSAGDLNLTLCEFRAFLCKLEKLSVQIKFQGLRYSRIFLWEGNGEPMDCLCLFTPHLPLIVLLFCICCAS